VGDQGKPFTPEADERELWARAEKEESKLLKTGKAYEDVLLEDYLSGIVGKLVPAEVEAAGAPPLRVGIFRDPTLNAFAMPNGRIYIHTGLLARVENEAQLAAILGHEITHVTHRHALQFQRDARNKQILFTVAGIVASLGVAVAAGSQAREGNWVTAEVLRATSHIFLGLGLQLAFIASVNGFGRDLEREADVEGMDRMVKAGYDPREAPKVFELLRKDHGDPGQIENFFFGNHPRLEERITSTQELLRTRYAGLDGAGLVRDTEDFPLRTRILVRENAALDIRAGRFNLAQAQLDRVLPLAPRDPVTHLYQGDLHRLRAQRTRKSDERMSLLAQARAAYERASALDPTYPDPHRQLGLLYYQGKDRERATEAFRQYLALKPDAEDARRVKEYLVELER
jgi:predicted Zn-dependent protease